jgi:hypothetical protein
MDNLHYGDHTNIKRADELVRGDDVGRLHLRAEVLSVVPVGTDGKHVKVRFELMPQRQLELVDGSASIEVICRASRKFTTWYDIGDGDDDEEDEVDPDLDDRGGTLPVPA